MDFVIIDLMSGKVGMVTVIAVIIGEGLDESTGAVADKKCSRLGVLLVTCGEIKPTGELPTAEIVDATHCGSGRDPLNLMQVMLPQGVLYELLLPTVFLPNRQPC